MSLNASLAFPDGALRIPLAACIAGLLAVSATSAWAAPPAVTNCDDSGSGSLRFAVDPVNGAVSGDTIDMSALGCSTITLTSGAITIPPPLQNLTLHGPGRKQLTIVGKNGAVIEADRIINHTFGATGHLYIDNLRMGYGQPSNASGGVQGGCVRSQGYVTLDNVGIYYCTATATSPTLAGNAMGGGVYAYAGLTISDGSVLLKNTVSVANSAAYAEGGGAFTHGPLDMSDSAVGENYAKGAGKSHGGGLSLRGNVTITGSVIGGNYSSRRGGGLFIAKSSGVHTTTISNSTISSNGAHLYAGGIYINSSTATYINNSTIALNEASHYKTVSPVAYYAPGLAIKSSGAAITLSLQSTIIANNSAGGTAEDLSTGPTPASVTITGSNNLVRAYKNDVALPSGQGNLPQGTCPKLGRLRFNGGPTVTHALQSGSPAIDAGNNSANDPHTGVPALYDQRGAGPVAPLYTRESGSADIGAYEYQKTDVIFYTEMETGCE